MREVIFVGTNVVENLKSLIVSEVKLDDIDEECLEGIDSLIFTSKNAIISIAQNAQKKSKLAAWQKLPSYLIGKGCAKECQKQGGNVAFIGSDSNGISFAKELSSVLVGKKPLYLRAKHIVSGLPEALAKSGIEIKSEIAYENTPRQLDKNLRPPSNCVLIFTSPSAYTNFKKNFGWDADYVAVAIGMTTFGVFDNDVMGFVSENQSLQACIELANDLASKIP